MEKPANIIYEDKCILIANKPAGLETVVEGGGKNCFSSILRRELSLKFLKPAHRLDRDTTGIQVFAKDMNSLSEIERVFRERLVKKNYLALCFGIPRNLTGTIRRNLSKWKRGRRPVQVVKGNKGVEAVTEYELIASADIKIPASLILFKPHHGRTHQVRVHASATGYPILGDDNYGDRQINNQARTLTGLNRYALHAWSISFIHPITNLSINPQSPIPQDITDALNILIPNWQEPLA